MSSLNDFKIDLKALRDDETTLRLTADDAFFKAIDAPQVAKGHLQVTVVLRKTTGFFDLTFHTEGTVVVECDRCLEEMDQPVVSDNRLTVKFGPAYAEEEALVTVPEDNPVVDLSWFVYEFIVLALPIKHVHEPGRCNVLMTEKLTEFSAARSSDGEAQPVDPRWKALERLRNQQTEN